MLDHGGHEAGRRVDDVTAAAHQILTDHLYAICNTGQGNITLVLL